MTSVEFRLHEIKSVNVNDACRWAPYRGARLPRLCGEHCYGVVEPPCR